jgi:hypothetical protein
VGIWLDSTCEQTEQMIGPPSTRFPPSTPSGLIKMLAFQRSLVHFSFSCMGKEKTFSDETQSSAPLKLLTLFAAWKNMMPFVDRPLTITI